MRANPVVTWGCEAVATARWHHQRLRILHRHLQAPIVYKEDDGVVVRRRLTRPGSYIVTDTSAATPADGVIAGIVEILTASREAADWHARWARRWARVYIALGLPSAILAATAGATGLASTAGRIPAAIIALIAAGLGAAATFLESGKQREYHDAMSGAWQTLANDAHVHQLVDVPNHEWLSAEGRNVLQSLSRRRVGLIQLKVPVDEDQSRD
jgi:hypothetical protein